MPLYNSTVFGKKRPNNRFVSLSGKYWISHWHFCRNKNNMEMDIFSVSRAGGKL